MTSKLPDLRESPFSSFEEVSRSHSPQQRTPTQGSNSTDSIELTTPRSASQSPLDPQFTPERLQHNAAVTIQAAVRGHFVRKRMIRPEHIDQEIAEILKTIDLAKQAKATAKQPQKSSSFDSDLSIASMSDSGSAILPGLPTAQREITPSELSSSGSAILPGFPTAQREITPSELNSISSALASQVREIAFAKEQPPKGHRTRLSTPDAPIDAWVTKIKSDLFEIEIIGEHKGRGAQTEVSASYILNLTLRSGGPKKTTKKVALAKFQTKHGQKIKMALDLLKTHFPEPDANLRITA